jgi:signal transduction histidine kinase
VVKQIVERHGGNIPVESPSKLAMENKPGASFKIKLFYEN